MWQIQVCLLELSEFFENIFVPWLVEPVAANPPNMEGHMSSMPTPVLLPGKFHGQRSQWATIPGVVKSLHDLATKRQHNALHMLVYI